MREDRSTLKLADDKDDITKRYKHFKKGFDNAFLASTAILSFYVIWTGVTINSINQFESVKFFSLMTGNNLISEDFPYLLGLLHTTILLTFYLPVKFKFDSMEIEDARILINQSKHSSL